LDEHGVAIRVPLARLTTSDGASGWGACRATPDQAHALLGAPLDDLFSPEPGNGARAPWLRWEYPYLGSGGQTRKPARVRARGGNGRQ
jgi:D-serine deaminase-like pyridoxal phosphate-dependent protein